MVPKQRVPYMNLSLSHDLKLHFGCFVLFRHEVSGLLSLVGSRLTKLNLMLEGRGQAANDALAVVNDSQVRLQLLLVMFCPTPGSFILLEQLHCHS